MGMEREFDAYENIEAPGRLKSKEEKYGTYARFSYSKLRINLQPPTTFIKYFYTVDPNQIPIKNKYNNYEIIGKVGDWFDKKNCYLIRCTCGALSIKTKSMLTQHISRGYFSCIFCSHQKSPYQIGTKINNFTITKIIFGPPLTYDVRCDCGHETNFNIRKIHKVKEGNTTWCASCKESIPFGEDITGKKFNNFTVIKYLGRTKITSGKRKAVKLGDKFEYQNDYIRKFSLWQVICTNCNTTHTKEHKELIHHVQSGGERCGVCKATNLIKVKVGLSHNGKTILRVVDYNKFIVGCNFCGEISEESSGTFFSKTRHGIGCLYCARGNMNLEENSIDLTGKIYGSLKCLEKIGRNKDSRQSLWKVECINCGEKYEREYSSIMNSMRGKALGCKKCKVPTDTITSRYEDFTGITAGIYKVLGPGVKPIDSTEADTCRFWNVQCTKCGDVRAISTGRVSAAKKESHSNCKKCGEILPIGKKAGGYTIMKFVGLGSRKQRVFELQCGCGEIKITDKTGIERLEKSGNSCKECMTKQKRLDLGYED